MKSHGLAGMLFFCLAAGSFAGKSIATIYVPCDECSLTQMSDAAISHGAGRVLVGDVAGNDVRAFRVYRAPERRIMGARSSAGNRLQADPDSVAPNEAAAFRAYVRFYNSAPKGYRKFYKLQIVKPGEPVGVSDSRGEMTFGDLAHSCAQAPCSPTTTPKPGGGTVSCPTPGINVYDVMNSGPKQNAFLGWLGNLTVFGISSQMDDAISAISVFHIDAGHVPALSFTVTFTDGSHIGVYVDTKQAPAQIVVNEGSGVDSHGNNVPATLEAVAGSGRQTYDFTTPGNPADHADMYQQITALGGHVSAGARTYYCVRTDIGEGARIDCAGAK